LLNKGDKDIDLDGWQIADKFKKKDVITNKVIKAGDTLEYF
jgi:hypothetical protein